MTVQSVTKAAARRHGSSGRATIPRRRSRLRHNLIQGAIVAALAAAMLGLILAIHQGLARHGITFSFSYLWQAAGFEISEGRTITLRDVWLPQFSEFTPTNTNAQALFAGLLNTLKVTLLAILVSTCLGTMLGIGRLSSNWLVRQMCFGLVEFVRNTPLLIQLIFWYFGAVLRFPPIDDAAKLFGGIIASQKGLSLPTLAFSETANAGAIILLAATLALALAALWTRGKWFGAILGLALACLLLSIAAGFPLTLDYPVVNRFRASGGLNVSPEMTALLIAIIVNSAAYIAEIVRGAIESMSKGQWEAAAGLGLNRRQTLRDVILPQIFRVVLPSFGNQYINLSKNTALGIAIGFPELFNIYGTIANQTGRMLEGMLIVMCTYLAISWLISGAINLLNARLSRGDRR